MKHAAEEICPINRYFINRGSSGISELRRRSQNCECAVEILDIHKLRDEMGEKTVAVDAFEGNNLVLVDEGHRGTSGAETGAWMQKRNQLCENGFSFEYSATFGQAMKASGNRALEQTIRRYQNRAIEAAQVERGR